MIKSLLEFLAGVIILGFLTALGSFIIGFYWAIGVESFQLTQELIVKLISLI